MGESDNTFDVLRVRRLVVQDRNGVEKVVVTGDPERNDGLLQILGPSGEPLLDIGLRHDGNPFIRLVDGAYHNRGLYLGTPEEIPTICIWKEGKTPTMVMEYRPEIGVNVTFPVL